MNTATCRPTTAAAAPAPLTGPSFYMRPLPQAQTALDSAAGRRLFAEALAAGGMASYFRLAQQFHTQADPAFCGLGTLVCALNALGVDPSRQWKGPWRWFSEELLDCCKPLDEIRRSGVSLDEVACLARCAGASVALHRAGDDLAATAAGMALRGAGADLATADDGAGGGRADRGDAGAAASAGASIALFRAHVLESATRDDAPVLIVNYSRRTLGQTGDGHFSPLGGYHAASDQVLVLDTARFKYPPHWVPVPLLYAAMQAEDAATGEPRGWLRLRAARPSLA